jgi:hypothetical protein
MPQIANNLLDQSSECPSPGFPAKNSQIQVAHTL